jgi:hypothetical protein
VLEGRLTAEVARVVGTEENMVFVGPFGGARANRGRAIEAIVACLYGKRWQRGFLTADSSLSSGWQCGVIRSYACYMLVHHRIPC